MPLLRYHNLFESGGNVGARIVKMLSSARPLQTQAPEKETATQRFFTQPQAEKPQCCQHKEAVERRICCIFVKLYTFCVFITFALPSTFLMSFSRWTKEQTSGVSTCASHHSSYHISSLYIMVESYPQKRAQNNKKQEQHERVMANMKQSFAQKNKNARKRALPNTANSLLPFFCCRFGGKFL